MSRRRQSLKEGGKGGTAVMVTVPIDDVWPTMVEDVCRECIN